MKTWYAIYDIINKKYLVETNSVQGYNWGNINQAVRFLSRDEAIRATPNIGLGEDNIYIIKENKEK
jgi:hypothetical protein